MRQMTLAFTLVLFVGGNSLLAEEQDPPLDWQRAQQLFQRSQKGETLSPEDQAYLERAKRARQQQGANQRSPAQTSPAPGGKDAVGLLPLSELGAGQYKGEDGGLYGGGKNEPPEAHRAAAKEALAKIVPLDPDGKPSKDGMIAFISMSMSNATMEFSRFKQVADADKDKSPLLTIVDCAQGGKAMAQWASADAPTWVEAERRLKAAGVAPSQVQVAWVKLANMGPTGDLAKHGRKLQSDTLQLLQIAKKRFPNLQIAYLSSRIYGGYATSGLNPEPYAYEGAFAVRWLIQDQIAGKPELNYYPAKGEVKSPLLLWGPYLWADGQTPRKEDGLTWERKDLSPNDGTHPSDSGRQKVAELLLKFFKTDPLAKTWFVKAGAEPKNMPEK